MLFEIGMLICFGAGWPVSVYKTWKVKKTDGKSIRFLLLVIVGYACGFTHKLQNDFDLVTWFYAFNGLMVILDLILTSHYRLKENAIKQAE